MAVDLRSAKFEKSVRKSVCCCAPGHEQDQPPAGGSQQVKDAGSPVATALEDGLLVGLLAKGFDQLGFALQPNLACHLDIHSAFGTSWSCICLYDPYRFYLYTDCIYYIFIIYIETFCYMLRISTCICEYYTDINRF